VVVPADFGNDEGACGSCVVRPRIVIQDLPSWGLCFFFSFCLLVYLVPTTCLVCVSPLLAVFFVGFYFSHALLVVHLGGRK
jgi:hypothetical protein